MYEDRHELEQFLMDFFGKRRTYKNKSANIARL